MENFQILSQFLQRGDIIITISLRPNPMIPPEQQQPQQPTVITEPLVTVSATPASQQPPSAYAQIDQMLSEARKNSEATPREKLTALEDFIPLPRHSEERSERPKSNNLKRRFDGSDEESRAPKVARVLDRSLSDMLADERKRKVDAMCSQEPKPSEDWKMKNRYFQTTSSSEREFCKYCSYTNHASNECIYSHPCIICKKFNLKNNPKHFSYGHSAKTCAHRCTKYECRINLQNNNGDFHDKKFHYYK